MYVEVLHKFHLKYIVTSNVMDLVAEIKEKSLHNLVERNSRATHTEGLRFMFRV